jgi:cellulose synthase/poly-beta-1,6-N-acetylglucosamine synthase-like glycosyltransferase
MFADWIQWTSSLTLNDLFWMLLPLFVLDGLRYVGGGLGCFVVDLTTDLWNAIFPPPPKEAYPYCPSVCVILAGLNEADTIGDTLATVWGSYPRMEIIVVDDGSNDGMAEVAAKFAATHEGVLVLRKPHRGGKSSALNFALPFTKADFLVCVDTDSLLGPNAIWEIVQPLADENVAAASGTVILRNRDTNLCTRLQAFEYLRNIFIGRMIASRLGILGIVSGAFGAFRRTALERVGGWDVGPGEDGDLVLRLRKQGYQVVFNPYAQCYTNSPTNFKWLFKQRRRWEWAVITFECRKHVDMANPFNACFTWSNFFLLLDRWLYGVILMYLGTFGFFYCMYLYGHRLFYMLAVQYVAYVLLETIQALLVIYYSLDKWRDLKSCIVLPLMPFFALFMRAATFVAVTEEIFTRRSFKDNFVPPHVRRVTWHW